MAGTYTMTPKTAKVVLQKILDDRKEIAEKTMMQLEAFNIGAKMLEQAVAGGAKYVHEAGIMRYHASNKTACVLHDDYTRRAIETAVSRIGRHIERYGDVMNAQA